jgi:cytochrome c-type biogenesis protein
VDGFLEWFRKFRPYLPWVMRASGVMLIVVGILLLTGEFTRLASWLTRLTPAGLLERL